MESFEEGGGSSSESTNTTVKKAPVAMPEPEESRYCWVCFATDEDGEMLWVQPCSCKGNFFGLFVLCDNNQCILAYRYNTLGTPVVFIALDR